MYTHPEYAMGFSATPAWEEHFLDEDGGVWQVVNPNRNIRVNLRFVKDGKHPDVELEQLAAAEGVICEGTLRDTLLGNREAIMLKGVCIQGREPFRRLLIGIPGKEGVYMMEICCPEECYATQRRDMLVILDSFWTGS